VTAEWNDWRLVHTRLGNLSDVHWHQPRGASHPLIHAWLLCSDVVGGELWHCCNRLSAPHRLCVCVLKKHNISSAYAELVRQADERCHSSHQPSSASKIAAVAPMRLR
jgi:hypothetical protein